MACGSPLKATVLSASWSFNRLRISSGANLPVATTSIRPASLSGQLPLESQELECAVSIGKSWIGHKSTVDWADYIHFSRTTWKEEPPDLDIETIRQSGNVGDDGYLNVASQFGLSTQRGMSPPLYPHPIPPIHLASANTHDPEQTIPCTRLSQLPDHRITLGRDSMLVVTIITSLIRS